MTTIFYHCNFSAEIDFSMQFACNKFFLLHTKIYCMHFIKQNACNIKKIYCTLKFIAPKLRAKNYFSAEITVVKYRCQIHKKAYLISPKFISAETKVGKMAN